MHAHANRASGPRNTGAQHEKRKRQRGWRGRKRRRSRPAGKDGKSGSSFRAGRKLGSPCLHPPSADQHVASEYRDRRHVVTSRGLLASLFANPRSAEQESTRISEGEVSSTRRNRPACRTTPEGQGLVHGIEASSSFNERVSMSAMWHFHGVSYSAPLGLCGGCLVLRLRVARATIAVNRLCVTCMSTISESFANSFASRE